MKEKQKREKEASSQQLVPRKDRKGKNAKSAKWQGSVLSQQFLVGKMKNVELTQIKIRHS